MKGINCKKFGFTLSEVLITLGVIGVVAAMTLPTVIKNYKKHVTETKLKQTYSILSQAFYMAQAKSGEFREWDSANGKTFFDTYWRPYLKVIKECNENACGYIPKQGFQYIFLMPNGTVWSTAFHYSINTRYGVVLNNGVFVFFHTKSVDGLNSDMNLVTVDLDYAKGLNTLGKDVFVFEYSAEGIKPSGYQLDDETQKQNCKTIGKYCSSLIMKNGWKITNDYPVKF